MQVFDNNNAPIVNSAIGNSIGYQGREWDKESGLWNFRNRMYSPQLGRFLQRDPSGYQDGINLYAFERNNPLRYLDAMGLSAEKNSQSNNSADPNYAIGLTTAIGSNTAKAIYKNLDANKLNTLWDNAAYSKYGPVARGAWSGLQGVGVTLGALKHVDILEAVGKGAINQKLIFPRKSGHIERLVVA